MGDIEEGNAGACEAGMNAGKSGGVAATEEGRLGVVAQFAASLFVPLADDERFRGREDSGDSFVPFRQAARQLGSAD